MNRYTAFGCSLSIAVLSTFTQSAIADSASATCEFYAHGQEKKGRSGPCTFSQRQGYIDIELNNGTSYNLSPGNNPDHYKDQEGRKLVRRNEGNKDVFTWNDDGRKIVVDFEQKNGNKSQGSSGDYLGKTPGNLKDMVGAKAGQAEATLRDRGYKYISGSGSEGEKYASWKDTKTGRCVMIQTLNGRYDSIVYTPEFDCQK